MVFQFFYFFGHFWPLGGLWGVLGVPNNSWGPPRATMSSLSSRDTLPQGSVPKNGPWLLIRLWFFNFFTLMVIFSHFWSHGGPLGVPRSLWGPPRAPMSSLTSRDTLPPDLVLLPVQLDKFADFLGRLCSLQFQRCNNNHHCHRGRGVAAGLPYASSDLRFFLRYPKS